MAVLGIATAAGWILYLSSPALKGPESTTSVERQPSQTNEQLNELETQLGLLTADHESLIQENLALRTLNEVLNEAQEEAAAGSSRADQQVLDLEQTVNSLNQSASSLQDERLQLLAQVDQLEKNQEETVFRFSEQLDKNNVELKKARQGQQEQSEEIVQLTERLDQVLGMSNDTMDDLQPSTDSDREISEVADTSMETTSAEAVAESPRADQQVLDLEQTVNNLNQSVDNLQNERHQLLAQVDQLITQLENLSQLASQSEIAVSDTTTMGDSASEQTAQTETAETMTQTSSEETSELAASLDELNSEVVASLKESVGSLQNERHQLLAQVDHLTAQLDSLSQLASQSETAVSDTTTMGDSASEQTAQTETAETMTQTSSEETSELAASLDELNSEVVASLKESVSSLQNERHQLLAQVDHLTAQLDSLSQLASQSETAVSDTATMGDSASEQTAQTETAETTAQTSSEETSELATSLDELNGEVVASLKESVSSLQSERLQLLAQVDQLEKNQEETVFRFSEQLDENNAELEKALQQQQEQSKAIVQLTEQLEQVLEMSNDTMEDLQPATDSDSEVSEVADTSMETTSAEAVAESPRADPQVLDLEQTVNNLNQSVGNLQDERIQLFAQVDHLTAQLENLSQLASQSKTAVSDTTTIGESASEQTAQTETAETTAQTSSEETSELVANLDELNSEVVASLKESVSGLQNQLQTTHNEVDRLALQLDSSNRRTKYLEIRLRYASKHLRRHRAKKRESEVKSENLVMEHQVLQENLSELSSTLNQSIVENKTEMALLVSKFSVIRLESDVIFDSGSAKLSTQGLETLRDIAQNYQDYPDRIMSIEGHTDNKLIAGNLARFYPTNWELSAARAAAAANFLTQQGVPEDKLRIVGFGALQPIASNDTEEGRASNRRIEIRLAPKLSEAETN